MLKNISPFKHQIEAVEDFSKTWSRALFWDVGTGKTLAALMCFDYAMHRAISDRLLVIAPISLIDNAWGEDIKKFTDLSYTNLNKKKLPNDKICIVNIESFISKSRLPQIIDWCRGGKTMCVIDESQKIKSYSTKSAKTVLAVKKIFTSKLILSGTPAPNDESEYWPQMSFLSSDIFPENFFAFRHRYFALTRGNFTLPPGGLSKSELGSLMKKGFKYRLLSTKKESFFSGMAPHVSWIKKEDVLDLPDQIDETRTVILGAEQRKAYNEMKYKLITEIQGQDVVASVALAKLTRLRQIVSGFSKSDDGNIVVLKENPKLSELLDCLDDIGDHQVMIFAEYHKEIDDIKSVLKEKAGILDGRTEDKNAVISAFKDRSIQYLIAHPLSGGVGLSFNECDYMVFYSLSYSSENYIQARGRIHRANKKNNATYIHLIAENTIDEIILKCVRDKRDKMEIIKEFLGERN
jgi:SNF2 family DNA or RNA helicase